MVPEQVSVAKRALESPETQAKFAAVAIAVVSEFVKALVPTASIQTWAK